MFRRTQMTAAMSQELMDDLTDHGRRDLSEIRMDDLESNIARHADAIFFPQARALGIEVEATCTPRVERKVVAANVTSSSREQASEQLEALAELSLSGKRCERITQRVGAQRVAEREQRLQQYESLPLPQQREVPADAPLGAGTIASRP